jgi:catechol 2,3-dioxygenase-like lactoylglutathione lyase family enzyme
MATEKDPFKLGHVLIKVNDLHQSYKAYEDLGFTVVWGSDPKKAHNALIYLADGSFLELIGFNRPGFGMRVLGVVSRLIKVPMLLRFALYYDGAPGLIDFALDTAGDFAETISGVQERGCNYTQPKPFSRTRPDGIQLKWFLSLSKRLPLPFIMSKYTPEIPRTKEETTHKNGITGIKELMICTTDLEKDAHDFKNLFNQPSDRIQENGKNHVFFSASPAIVCLQEGDYDRINDISFTTNSSQPVYLSHLSLQNNTYK